MQSMSSPTIAQQSEHGAVSHLLRPGPRRRPWLGVRFHRVGSPIQQQLHQLHASPPACPTQRRALEQVVARLESCAGVQSARKKSTSS